MTVHIEGIELVIFAVGCITGYFVYKQGLVTHLGVTAPHGDLGGGIGAAAAVITVLLLLFGNNGEKPTTESTPTPTITVTVTPNSTAEIGSVPSVSATPESNRR